MLGAKYGANRDTEYQQEQQRHKTIASRLEVRCKVPAKLYSTFAVAPTQNRQIRLCVLKHLEMLICRFYEIFLPSAELILKWNL